MGSWPDSPAPDQSEGADWGQDRLRGGATGQSGWYGLIRGRSTGGWPASPTPDQGRRADLGWGWAGRGAAGGWPAGPTPFGVREGLSGSGPTGVKGLQEVGSLATVGCGVIVANRSSHYGIWLVALYIFIYMTCKSLSIKLPRRI